MSLTRRSMMLRSSGGGNTIVLPAKDIDEIKEYTHPDDWITDALGNTKNFADTYMDATNPDETRFRIAYIYENSYTGSYKASTCWCFKSGASSIGFGGAFQNAYPNRGYSSSNSWRLAAGSKIRVIYLSPIKRSSSGAMA